MGEAKRRKATDPTYGQPQPYICQVHNGDGREVMDIPYLVQRIGNIHATHKRAIALAMQIMGYLINQDDAHYRLVAIALGDESAALLADALGDVPEKFWCSILEPAGIPLQSPEGGLIVLSSHADVQVPCAIAGDWEPYNPADVIHRAVS